MKKMMALVLTLALLLGTVPPASAARLSPEAAAQKLYELGLFKGVGTKADGSPNFDLNRKPTRYEGVTMLVRLLGKAEAAEAGTWETPFTDVVDWAKPYVGYAYANHLTSGTSATTFGGDATITCAQYLTFLLRALGYTSGTDFQWDVAWEFTDEIGLTNGQLGPEGNENLYRSGVAALSVATLDVLLKDSEFTLLETIFPEEEPGADAPVSPAPADRVATDYDPILDTFHIPAGLGKPRYNRDEIQKMIDDDLSLNQVAQMIATYADLLQYLHMKGFGTVPGPVGDLQFSYPDRYHCSMNRAARVVFRLNDGNCGGDSNLANYILKGDYDSQGYVAETANMGGHLYNYFEVDGLYYFCDLTQFVHGGEWRTNYRIVSTDTPQTFSDDYIRDNHSREGVKSEKYLLLQYMYEYDGSHRPSGSELDGMKTVLGYPYSHVLSNEVESVTTVLYVEEGYPTVEFMDPPPLRFWPVDARR